MTTPHIHPIIKSQINTHGVITVPIGMMIILMTILLGKILPKPTKERKAKARKAKAKVLLPLLIPNGALFAIPHTRKDIVKVNQKALSSHSPTNLLLHPLCRPLTITVITSTTTLAH